MAAAGDSYLELRRLCVASGNAIFAMTERYIVGGNQPAAADWTGWRCTQKQRRMQISWLALMAVSGILLVGALVIFLAAAFQQRCADVRHRAAGAEQTI